MSPPASSAPTRRAIETRLRKSTPSSPEIDRLPPRVPCQRPTRLSVFPEHRRGPQGSPRVRQLTRIADESLSSVLSQRFAEEIRSMLALKAWYLFAARPLQRPKLIQRTSNSGHWQVAEKVCHGVTRNGARARQRDFRRMACAETTSSRRRCTATFRRSSGWRKNIRFE
jgi:hypothetical protein